MKTKIWLIFVFFTLCPLFLFSMPLYAQGVSAEIININTDQKIIFIDLGRDVLNVGDIMSVDGCDHPVFLEVIGTSDAVSKLRISKNAKYYSNISEFDNVTVGMKVTRVSSPEAQETALAVSAPAAAALTPTDMASAVGGGAVAPSVDAQAFVKPDLAHESIQSIVDRMNRMVDGNVKLSNALAQCQANLGESQKLVSSNDDLKKQLDELNSKYSDALVDRDKYKKQTDDLLTKISELKTRLDHLDALIGEH